MQAVTLSAFLYVSLETVVSFAYYCPHFPRLLLIEYVAATASGHDAENAIARKDKRKLPIPVCPFVRLFLWRSKSVIRMIVLLLEVSSDKGMFAKLHLQLLKPLTYFDRLTLCTH